MTNKDRGFYKIMGPVFGSREIQRVTNDRLYDDPEKKWIINISDENDVDVAISINNNAVKNIYSKNDKEAIKILKEYFYCIESGIVPSIYR